MRRITPFLWFTGNAEEAVNFYVSIFKNSKITDTMRYGDAGPGKKGAVMSITYELEGKEFIALNGEQMFNFTPAISFFVHCETQQELDEIWDKIAANGGKPIQCGWITDKFGLTWQLVPTALGEMLQDTDEAKSARVMAAMMGMIKLDINELKQAYDGKA